MSVRETGYAEGHAWTLVLEQADRDGTLAECLGPIVLKRVRAAIECHRDCTGTAR
jgi:hypothetical protein